MAEGPSFGLDGGRHGGWSRNLKVPTLIVHGREDLIQGTVAVENQGFIPNSKLVWIERSGHFSYLEQPEAVEKAMFGFLLP